MEFIHFNDVKTEKPESWKSKAILTLDIDWATDEQLNFVLDIIEKADVKACFFVTHDTPVLKRIRNNKKLELGLHPNFNPLILAETIQKNAYAIIHDLKKIVPEANVLRSHSMTTSGRWLSLYKEVGVKYLSNYFLHGVNGICPFHQINGLTEIPVYYADDGYLYAKDTQEVRNIEFDHLKKCSETGIKVFNFHPIHIFLNSSCMNDYTLYKKGTFNTRQNSERFGIRTIFNHLIAKE